MNSSVHFSSASDNWSTPQCFFNAIDTVFNFELDVCSSKENAKCKDFFTVAENGLLRKWEALRCWMNPPYGREIGLWMKKAYTESLNGARVVCLVPARTDTAWWHEYAFKGRILFIRGRLKFGGHINSAPFPSALVFFGCDEFYVNQTKRFLETINIFCG